MSIETLTRILTASKWVLGVLAVLTAIAGVFNQWVSDRITSLQNREKSDAQRRLQLSQEELRQTREKTERLEAVLAPRILSEEQQTAIAARLRAYATTQFEFVSYQDDGEVRGLVISLIKTLQAARWKGLPARAFLMASLIEGVIIQIAPASEGSLGPAARALAAALNETGIAARVAQTDELAEFADRVQVKVGKKPSPAH
ncbi:MAG: hypothetical protein AB7O32_00620 [Vicinamibacterales bacterium]